MQTRIRKAREQRNITKSKAAEELGISLKTLYNYEHGQEVPSSVLIKMSQLYDYSTDYLLGLSTTLL